MHLWDKEKGFEFLTAVRVWVSNGAHVLPESILQELRGMEICTKIALSKTDEVQDQQNAVQLVGHSLAHSMAFLFGLAGVSWASQFCKVLGPRGHQVVTVNRQDLAAVPTFSKFSFRASCCVKLDNCVLLFSSNGMLGSDQ